MSTVPSATAAWAAVYDPANSGAYASVVGTLVSQKHLGPVAVNDNNAAIFVETASGFRLMSVSVPPVAPTAGTPVTNEGVGSNWFACSDTAAVAGYFKWAIDGTASTPTAEVFIVYHMEYRMRS
jgi:hypothetical protein